MSDIDQGTDTDQPADDIRSLLDDAFDQAETPATDAPAADKGAAKPEDDAAGGKRERAADGKFLKKDDAAPAPKTVTKSDKTAADTPDKTAAAATDDATKAVTASDSKLAAPESWPPADKEAFKQLPESLQKLVADREKAMLGDYTRKTQEAAHLKKEYGPVDELFAPHKDVMRQKGFTPRSLIESWANVEQKLAGGPDSAIEVIKGLVGGYNLPVAKLAAALGISAPTAAAPAKDGQQPTATENGQVVALPPEVQAELKALREQVGQFGQRFQTIDQQNANARRAQEIEQENAVVNQVNEFKSAVDEKGSLKHPHFEEVEAMMTSLAQAALASKQPVPSLDQLYETAVYANPSTRDKVLTAQRQQEETKRTEVARAKAASARRAGSSVTGAPGNGQAPSGRQASELSLREQLEAAAEEDAA